MRFFNTLVLVAAFTAGTACLATAQSCPGFRTQTQGGWGSTPNGNNPGAYLHANFAAAFPQGITVGCTDKLKLSSAQAVTNFLPSGSTASALPAGTLTNPGNAYNNVFAGQVVTLAISIGLDNAIPSFGASNTNLKNLVIGSGTFAGWTVQQLFDEANKKLGGCASPYSFAQLNEAVDKINNSYVDGNASGSYLICPTVNPPSVAVTGIGHIPCFGGNSGSVNITVSGGTQPYSFNWSNGATTEDLSNLPAGSYGVTVTSANGATASANATVNQPAFAVSAVVSSTNPTCAGASNGSALVSASGGTPPYTYLWSNGKTTAANNDIGAGTYNMTVTDGNGCTASASFVLAAPQPLVLTAVSSNPSCHNACSGSVNLTAAGGNAPYFYNWSNGATVEDLANLCAGVYIVAATDANGCTATNIHSLSAPSGLEITVGAANPTCANTWSGLLELDIAGGTAPYAVQWSNGQGGASLHNLTAGEYCYTVTDAQGCSTAGCASLEEPEALLAYMDCACGGLLCFGECTAHINLTVFGGTAPYAFEWSNGAATEDVSNLCAGFYEVTVTDDNGCTFDAAHAPIEQAEPIDLVLVASDDTDPNDGICDGYAYIMMSEQHFFNGIEWSNAYDDVYNFNLCPGEYCVTVTSPEGCRATECIAVGGGNARIADETGTTLSFTANVYPNPNNGAFALQVTAASDATVTVRLFDAMGREMMRTAFDVTAGQNQFATALPDAAAGVYNVVVSDGRKTVARPMYITK